MKKSKNGDKIPPFVEKKSFEFTEECLKLCPYCGGTGYISADALIAADFVSEDILNPDICLYCNGNGSID